MEEAQRLADRVVVLARGRVIAEGTPDELGRDDDTTLVGFRLPGLPRGLPLPADARVERGAVSFRTATPTRDLAPLLEWAAARGMELEHLTVTPSHARGRLPRADRGGRRMTAFTAELPLLGRWIAGRIRMNAAQPARARLHLRVPADPGRALQRAQRQRRGRRLRRERSASPSSTRPRSRVFSLVTACYTTLILGLATARDSGLLKRVRGTPLPMGIYLGSWVTGAAADRDRRRSAAVRVSVPAFGVEIYAQHAAGRGRDAGARRRLPGRARRRRRERWSRAPSRRCRSRSSRSCRSRSSRASGSRSTARPTGS